MQDMCKIKIIKIKICLYRADCGDGERARKQAPSVHSGEFVHDVTVVRRAGVAARGASIAAADESTPSASVSVVRAKEVSVSRFVGVHVQAAAQTCPSRPQLGHRNRPGEIRRAEFAFLRAPEPTAYAHRPNNRALRGAFVGPWKDRQCPKSIPGVLGCKS